MVIAHNAVPMQRCTFEVWDGDIGEAEVGAHLLRLAVDPDWPPGPLNLVDLTTIGTISIPDPDLVALLREGTILETELKTALIVGPELMREHASPAYDQVASATGVTVFTDSRAAAVHLGIDVDLALRLLVELRRTC